MVNTTFGQTLFDYLRTDDKHKRLPLAYRVRRSRRLKEEEKRNSIKARALQNAIKDIGVEENPPYSNNVKFTDWYGLRGPWCAMAVSKWFIDAGDTQVFKRGVRTAWAYWPEEMARARQHRLTITNDPEPGDIVVYHINQGHIGIFEAWHTRSIGSFYAIEGNTSVDSDDNGGKVMRRHRGRWNNPVFVRYGY